MGGNDARVQAIRDVEAYLPPAVSFMAAEAPGQIFGLGEALAAEASRPRWKR